MCYRLPYTFITREVAEATCACLMAQAEEAERTRQMDVIQERMIIEEFGRCLMQVIESATKTKGKGWFTRGTGKFPSPSRLSSFISLFPSYLEGEVKIVGNRKMNLHKR